MQMQYNIIDENSVQYKQDQRRLRSLRTTVVLWLIVLALGVVLIPLMLITSWVRSDLARLESELIYIQSALSDAKSPSPEMTKLNGEVTRFEHLISTIQTVTVPSSVNWPIVVDAVVQYEKTALIINSLTQTADKIQITGRAISNDAVVRYQQNLLDSGAFRDVIVISMATLPPTPTPVVEEENADAENSIERPFGNVEFVIDLLVEKSTP